jgi:hypothetical protein
MSLEDLPNAAYFRAQVILLKKALVEQQAITEMHKQKIEKLESDPRPNAIKAVHSATLVDTAVVTTLLEKHGGHNSEAKDALNYLQSLCSLLDEHVIKCDTAKRSITSGSNVELEICYRLHRQIDLLPSLYEKNAGCRNDVMEVMRFNLFYDRRTASTLDSLSTEKETDSLNSNLRRQYLGTRLSITICHLQSVWERLLSASEADTPTDPLRSFLQSNGNHLLKETIKIITNIG